MSRSIAPRWAYQLEEGAGWRTCFSLVTQKRVQASEAYMKIMKPVEAFANPEQQVINDLSALLDFIQANYNLTPKETDRAEDALSS